MKKVLLELLATILIWGGVALVANTWVQSMITSTLLGSLAVLYSSYHFWIAVILFIVAARLYKYGGQLEEREKIGRS